MLVLLSKHFDSDVRSRIPEGPQRYIYYLGYTRNAIVLTGVSRHTRAVVQLNTIGEGTDWLSDPQVFGNYNVAYVSSGSSEKSNPAGGRWRGKLGRSLFRRVASERVLRVIYTRYESSPRSVRLLRIAIASFSSFGVRKLQRNEAFLSLETVNDCTYHTKMTNWHRGPARRKRA